jgi:hypothetical protein
MENTNEQSLTGCERFGELDRTGIHRRTCNQCQDRFKCNEIRDKKTPTKEEPAEIKQPTANEEPEPIRRRRRVPSKEVPEPKEVEQPEAEPEETKSFEEIMAETCGGRGPRKVSKKKCAACDNFKECQKGYLNYFTPIPNYILDNMSDDLSPSAQLVFHAINRLVDFRRSVDGGSNGNKYYNKCWATYSKLSQQSGVAKSNMGKYVSELMQGNYIWLKQITFSENGNFNKVNEFRVVWRNDGDELEINYEKRGSL